MKSYSEIAAQANLFGQTKVLFMKYMYERWPDISKIGSVYAHQWALRFKRDEAYCYSDSIGQKILKGLGYIPKTQIVL